jgi:hypothetical protein
MQRQVSAVPARGAAGEHTAAVGAALFSVFSVFELLARRGEFKEFQLFNHFLWHFLLCFLVT